MPRKPTTQIRFLGGMPPLGELWELKCQDCGWAASADPSNLPSHPSHDVVCAAPKEES